MTTIQEDIRRIIRKYINESYLPSVILNEEESHLVDTYQNNEGLHKDNNFLKLSLEKQRWIITSLSTGLYYKSSFSQSDVIDKEYFISKFIFSRRHLKKLRTEATEYISTIEKEYNQFAAVHEELLDEVQSQIDIINKRKVMMKENILRRVASRLQEMGIKSEVADYPMEFLDYRNFGLNEEFKDVQKDFNELQKSTYSRFSEDLFAIPFILDPIEYFLVIKRIYKLEKQLQNIKTVTTPIFEKMKSDNQKVDDLFKALKNIADIFTDINSKFIPAIENILDLIDDKYHNNLAEVPSDVLCMLRTATRILKEISEKCILPKSDKDALIESTIITSNNISVEYNNLKDAMSDAA